MIFDRNTKADQITHINLRVTILYIVTPFWDNVKKYFENFKNFYIRLSFLLQGVVKCIIFQIFVIIMKTIETMRLLKGL